MPQARQGPSGRFLLLVIRGLVANRPWGRRGPAIATGCQEKVMARAISTPSPSSLSTQVFTLACLDCIVTDLGPLVVLGNWLDLGLVP